MIIVIFWYLLCHPLHYLQVSVHFTASSTVVIFGFYSPLLFLLFCVFHATC